MYRRLFSFTLPVELCSARPNCGATQSFGGKVMPGSSCDCSSLGSGRLALLKTDLSHSRGSSVSLCYRVKLLPLPACRRALRGELLALVVPPQLRRQPWPPPTVWFLLAPPR